MKILYKGIFCEEEIVKKVLETNNYFPFAQQKLEKAIINGIEKNGCGNNINVLSTIPVLRYPKYKKIVINKKNQMKNGINIIYTHFVNLPIFKQITVFCSNAIQAIKWSWKNRKDKNKYVIIYGTNPLNTIPFLLLKKMCKYKVIPIVSEIDKLRILDNRNVIHKIKNYIFMKLSSMVQNSFDGYILICKQMNEIINKKNKPYLVIEGMIESNLVQKDIIYKDKENIIMYAGSLHKKYGISKLVDAFDNIKDTEYKLIIYGDGDYKEKLIERCKINKRIIYGGVLENEKIIEMEQKAKILVNPRPSEEIFTKYSFPSKTLEYFLSGTVALITKLEGIPKEYFNYCYTLENEDVKGFEETIRCIINKPDSELEKMAKKAQRFVLENKNNIVQTKKILEFINKI